VITRSYLEEMTSQQLHERAVYQAKAKKDAVVRIDAIKVHESRFGS
jgi:hypothetical protein